MILKQAPLGKPRLYYLDWLRVIAFSILLFEHSAEIFTDWNFWVKNEQTSSFLSYVIAFFLPWRMPLLFLISGAAVTLSFKRKSIIEYFKERSMRLLLPLAFAILVIIPPQLYFIRLYRGGEESFWHFYQNILSLNWTVSTKGNIHFMHLWYLAYLFVYCLFFVPVLQFARTEKGKQYIQALCDFVSKPAIILLLGPIITIPFYILIQYRPFDIYTAPFLYYLPFFVCGALLFTDSGISLAINKSMPVAITGAILSTIVLYMLSASSNDPQNYFLSLSEIKSLPMLAFKSLNQWFWIIAIFGLAIRLVNDGSERLSYATQAIYPFYILHQTVIVIAGYYIVQMQGSVSYKLCLVTLVSFGIIYLIYELIIKKANWIKVLFGVKPQPIHEKKVTENRFKDLVFDKH